MSVSCRSGGATTRRSRFRGTSGCHDGVQFQVNYTGSRNTQATAPLNQGEPLFEELTDTHRPHVLRLSGGWNMPRFESRGWAMRYLLGGWQINTSTYLRSGLPSTCRAASI